MHILFISSEFLTDLHSNVQGIHKRMSIFIEALKGIAQLDMLFYVSPEVEISPEFIVEQEEKFSQHWNTKIKLFLCPWATEHLSRPKWQQQGRGILNFFQQADFAITSQSQQIQAFEACLDRKPDAIFAHRLQAMCPILQTQRELPPVFFDLDDVEHIKFMRQIRQPPTRLRTSLYYLQIPARLRGELRAIRRAHRTFVCSTHDRHYLSDRWKLPGVVSVPNAISIPEPQPLTTDPTLLLLGGYYYFPNINAANFLIDQVWQRIYKEMPNAKLIVAGPSPHNIRSYGQQVPGVEFPGFVPDLDALYRQTRIVCCPIFSGGGTRVKMIEAAAYGKPIVATRIGAEGLEMVDGRDFLMRDTAATFAEACLQLLKDDALSQRLGEAARVAAIQHYDRSNIVRFIQNEIQNGLNLTPVPTASHPVSTT
jgi:glycosyltransferase involved in cell wall biosynthesis